MPVNYNIETSLCTIARWDPVVRRNLARRGANIDIHRFFLGATATSVCICRMHNWGAVTRDVPFSFETCLCRDVSSSTNSYMNVIYVIDISTITEFSSVKQVKENLKDINYSAIFVSIYTLFEYDPQLQ